MSATALTILTTTALPSADSEHAHLRGIPALAHPTEPDADSAGRARDSGGLSNSADSPPPLTGQSHSRLPWSLRSLPHKRGPFTRQIGGCRAVPARDPMRSSSAPSTPAAASRRCVDKDATLYPCRTTARRRTSVAVRVSLYRTGGGDPGIPGGPGGVSGGSPACSAARHSCARRTAVAPSPTADATRLTERWRTAFQQRKRRVRKPREGGARSSDHPGGSAASRATSRPVRT